MSRFARKIAPHVIKELARSRRAERRGDQISAFRHLENAHVLGQMSTYWHTVSHYKMLCFGVKHHDWREIRGQILRIIGALSKTALKLVPAGNTGGSNISPFKVLSVDPALQKLIDSAR
jgi:hypothetical protein